MDSITFEEGGPAAIIGKPFDREQQVLALSDLIRSGPVRSYARFARTYPHHLLDYDQSIPPPIPPLQVMLWTGARSHPKPRPVLMTDSPTM